MPQPETPRPEQPASEPAGGIQDLPDGRPQYGVRVDPQPEPQQPGSDDTEETDSRR